MKKKIISLIGLGLFWVSMQAKAICPICTIAVVAGVGLSRYLGIDDTITGLWIGGLTVSLIMWTILWFDHKKFTYKGHPLFQFKGRTLLTTIIYYALTVGPFFYTDIIGHPLNKLWGVDKLVLGAIIGSLFFWAGGGLYFYTKKKNNNKALFPFQKVVFPLLPLIILSIVFFYITR